MIAVLSEDNTLKVTKQTVPALASLNANFTLYVSNVVSNWNPTECDVFLVVYNTDKEIYSVKLKQIESSKENLLAYEVPAETDFSVKSGSYSVFVYILNPISNTHITSTTSIFTSVESSDSAILNTIGSNIFDETYASVKGIKTEIEGYLETIKKLTQLNIQINKDLEKKVGELNG